MYFGPSSGNENTSVGVISHVPNGSLQVADKELTWFGAAFQSVENLQLIRRAASNYELVACRMLNERRAICVKALELPQVLTRRQIKPSQTTIIACRCDLVSRLSHGNASYSI